MTLKRSFVGVFSLLTEKIQLSRSQGSHKPRQAQAKGRRKHKSRQSKAAAIQLYEKNCPVSARSLVSDNSSLIHRTPVCVWQHASNYQHATIGTHFAAIKKRSLPSFANTQRLARILRPSKRTSTNFGTNLATTRWQSKCHTKRHGRRHASMRQCLSRLPRRPVRLWLRFRSGRRCRQRAACPWIPCL